MDLLLFIRFCSSKSHFPFLRVFLSLRNVLTCFFLFLPPPLLPDFFPILAIKSCFACWLARCSRAFLIFKFPVTTFRVRCPLNALCSRRALDVASDHSITSLRCAAMSFLNDSGMYSWSRHSAHVFTLLGPWLTHCTCSSGCTGCTHISLPLESTLL